MASRKLLFPIPFMPTKQFTLSENSSEASAMFLKLRILMPFIIISAKILDFPQICKQKTQYCQSALRCGCVDGARRRGAVAKKCPAPRGGRAPGYILSEAVTSLPLIGFLFRFLKCALLHVTNMRSVRIAASGGDDDRRRAFPPPRI